MSAVPVLSDLAKTFDFDDIKFSRSCSTCVYADSSKSNARICRRYPPISSEGLRGWPIVYSDDWCGEYLPVASNH